MELKKGALVTFFDGVNIGKVGKVISIEEQTGQKRKNFLISIKDQKGSIFKTILDYAFVIGKEKSRISFPDMEVN
jgi:ribosomal protein S4E